MFARGVNIKTNFFFRKIDNFGSFGPSNISTQNLAPMAKIKSSSEYNPKYAAPKAADGMPKVLEFTTKQINGNRCDPISY